jgi:hypothetical protein
MEIMVLLLAASLAALAAATADSAAGRGDPSQNDAGPVVSREADGAFIVRRAIVSDPASSAQRAHGLVETEGSARAAPDPLGRPRSTAEEAADEDLGRAFEEALDMARFGAGPR